MGDSDREAAADKLNRNGAEPEAESGAGYGSHAQETEKPDEPAAGTQ
ncbi:hypothetical protein [Sphingomonas sp.]|nr:hypothetical protein [Sphingomonas sp.]HEU0044657.1 hypothetical protein [Sphingomonas sp.]